MVATQNSGADLSGAATAGGAFSAVGHGLKYAACQAACFIPVLGIPIRMTIAGATIEALGHSVVAHYERKHQGKVFTKPAPVDKPADTDKKD